MIEGHTKQANISMRRENKGNACVWSVTSSTAEIVEAADGRMAHSNGWNGVK